MHCTAETAGKQTAYLLRPNFMLVIPCEASSPPVMCKYDEFGSSLCAMVSGLCCAILSFTTPAQPTSCSQAWPGQRATRHICACEFLTVLQFRLLP